MSDTISRKGVFIPDITVEMFRNASLESIEDLMASGEMEDILLPSAQPEPLSDAYMKAVWTWLSNYQIKAAELKGRYTPYEVLSWVANDWRKEHERFNQQTGGD